MALGHGRSPLHFSAALRRAGLLSFTGNGDHVNQVQRFAERPGTPRDIDLDGIESYLFQRFERRIGPLNFFFRVAEDGHANFRNGERAERREVVRPAPAPFALAPNAESAAMPPVAWPKKDLRLIGVMLFSQ